jgi:hypothetical protein
LSTIKLMKPLYCWRCRVVVPMLDEDEFKIVSQLYSAAMSATKEFREQHSLPLGKLAIDERFAPCRDAYERLTGYRGMHQNAIMHHRLSLYGPPCPNCGKPFRTPTATGCFESGCPSRSTNA